MCKKLIFLVSPILLLVLASNAVAQLDPASVTDGHVYLFEDVGTDVPDDSANTHTANLIGSPQVVDGLKGKALQFNGISDGVHIPDAAGINTSIHQNHTVVAVFKCSDVDKSEKQCVYEEGGSTRGLTIYVHEGLVYAAAWNRADYTPQWNPGTFISAPISSNQWVAVVAVLRGGGPGQEDDKFEMWMDGELIGIGPGGQLQGRSDDIGIGNVQQQTIFHDGIVNAGYWLEGTIDEIWILNQALTQVELRQWAGKPWPYAFGPTPADGALYEDTWLSLSWKPAKSAVSHDVYLGENFDDVNAGVEGTFQGNQAGIDFIVGFPGFPYPDGLVPGTTYYWRVDEVNEAEPNSPWKGSVWSFSIPPKTAYFPDPADGAELVELDAKFSWTAGFGAILHYAYFGDNFDDVKNASGNPPWGSTTYDPGPLELAKTYYWRVDEFDAIETHKGDVWSFTTEGAVGSPNPANGAVDVKQTQIINWSPSVFAASHQLYFGTDKDAVKNADTGSPEYKGTRDLGSESYDPGMLAWDTTYYWRVDEVNNVNPDSPWTGILWSFTTANFLIVDDFESYNDLDPADPESNRIFNAWIDGYDDPTNGSLVGYDNPPFAEQTIVHSGNQSMPMSYDNSVGKSEATLTLTYPRDWTENGVSKLTIWFRGRSANAAETLYVALNGSAVVNHDNPDAAQTGRWTEWSILLQAFADQGVNLANVNTIALGLGNRNNPVAGGSGTMYFDDIRLYPPPPEPEPAP
ncbi:MAG: hypothetical protein ACETWQ_06225 [Phycisphaerae bacterium]